MHAQALSIWPGVSLTLVRAEQGWQFGTWRTYKGDLPSPPHEECVRWFATAEDAAAHFRALCPRE
jgi:hypothetical protein